MALLREYTLVTGLPAISMSDSFSLRCSDCGIPGRPLPLKGRSWAVTLAGFLLWFWRAGPTYSGRIITGAYYLAIFMPFMKRLTFRELAEDLHAIFMD